MLLARVTYDQLPNFCSQVTVKKKEPAQYLKMTKKHTEYVQAKGLDFSIVVNFDTVLMHWHR